MGFDSTRLLAWFEPVDPVAVAGVGDLCNRHASAMVLPRGWTLEDRRSPAVPAPPADQPARPRRKASTPRKPRRKKWEQVPEDLFENPARPEASATVAPVAPAAPVASAAPAAPAPPEAPVVAPAPVTAPAVEGVADTDGGEADPAWTPQFEVDDLDGLLSAKSPLLSRAFRAAKNG